MTAIEMPDGSEHPLWPQTAPDDPGWITSGYWRYDRPTRTLRLPNGLIYTFNYAGLPTHRVGEAWYATDIRDPFGNRLEITYNRCQAAVGARDTIQQIRQHLGGEQVRTVQFTVDAACMLRTMTYEGRTWTYTHVPADVSVQEQYVLTEVKRPGPGFTTWRFGYGDSPPGFGPVVTLLTTPMGGRVTYQYARVPWAVKHINRDSFMVTRRSAATDHAQSADGTWTFLYAQGTHRDTSVVTTPCGQIQYRFWGFGTDPAADYSGWLAGLIRERRILTSAGAELEREELGWMPGERVSHEGIPGIDQDVWASTHVQPALLTLHRIHRQTESWETTHEYRASPSGVARYNDFGHPWRTTARDRSTNQSRVSQRSFVYGFTPYVVGRVGTETVTRAGQSLTTTRTYDLGTGFVTSDQVGSLKTTYERTAQGNVGAVIDGRGNRTTLTYQGGVVREARTPLLTTTRLINPDGTVASETVAPGTAEALTTTYSYDGAGRLEQITPPVGHTIVPGVENVAGRYIRSRRASVWTHTFLDGFGQAVSTEDISGVKTRASYDACGRVTQASAPFTTSTPRFTAYTYDALGRTLTSRAPENSLTRYAYTGLQTTVTDAEDRTTRYTSVAESGPAGARLDAVTDAMGVTTRYRYHVSGQLERVEGPGSGVARTWTYDTRGLLTEDTQPESGRTQYAYDAAGNLTRITNAAGQIINFTYDANNRLTRRSSPLTTFAYDAAGRVREQVRAGVTTTFTFDGGGRAASRRDVLGGLNVISRYGYDGHDNLTRLTYPSGRVVTYEYDEGNRLTGVLADGQPFATNFTYADNGQLARYTTGTVAHTVTYDDRDRVRQLQSGSAIRLTYTYDRVNRVKGIADGRVGMNQAFGYDALDRVATANGPWGALSWSYDAHGNRTTEVAPSGTTTYTYHATTRHLTRTNGAMAETFQYDAVGRMTRDGRGSYTYTPVGELATAAASGVAATYGYDAEGWRVERTVNDIRHVTIRSLGQQTLSEYAAPCGVLAWQRDLIYAGSRLLGAIKASQDLPQVRFTAATSSVNEGAGAATVAVQMTTPSEQPLACPVTVSFSTAHGTTSSGDLTLSTGTRTFGTGTASGATRAITIPITDDSADEPNEKFTVSLAGPSGAELGTPSTHTVTIVDNDPAPSLTINDVTVREDAGTARLTVRVQPTSGKQVRVNYATASGTATSGADYVAQSGTLTLGPGSATATIQVPIVDNTWAEPTETFTVRLSAPVNATISRGTGTVTITDDERPRVPIDPTKPGHYFADVTSAPDSTNYLIVANPQSTAITARLTFTRRDGSGYARNFPIGGNRRVGIHVQGEAGVEGDGTVSAVVQTMTAGTSIVAEQVVYWGENHAGGRATEGVTPAPVWYFAEGATHSFVEDLTIFNPSNERIDAVIEFYGANGLVTTEQRRIQAGPGRIKLRLSNMVPGIEHATIVRGVSLSGEAVPIVAERVMTWNGGRQGHSSPGQSTTRSRWDLAEGGTHFDTFVAIFNAGTASTTARVTYKHEGTGDNYATEVAVPAKARRTVLTPSWLPAGNFALRVQSLNDQPLAVERVMYGGTNWAVGTAGTGLVPGTQAFLAEGAPTAVFDTFLVVTDTSGEANTVTVQVVREDGWMTTRSLAVPGNRRRTLHLGTVSGLEMAGYQLRLSSTRAFVAERATYWPRVSGAAALALTGEGEAASAREADPPDPPTSWPPGPPGAGLYVDVVEGVPANDEAIAAALGLTPQGVTSEATASSSGWSGGHVGGGVR